MSDMFSRVYSAQPGINDGCLIVVETDRSRGLNAFTIVGLPDKAVEESRDRVGSALKNSGLSSPKHTNFKTIVSLAPAEVKKEGAFFDVPIALGYLLSAGEITFDPQGKIFVGELALNGEIKSVRGILPIVQFAKNNGYTEVYVPFANRNEASLIEGITVFGVRDLQQLIAHFHKINPVPIIPEILAEIPKVSLKNVFDMRDIKGQELAKRGLQIAAAGGHNVGMYGPPGTGKTMLARAFASILPSLSRNEMLEITGIHSLAGILDDYVVTEPPFRAPHHTSSHVAVIGGGTIPKPGEVTLAHHGVLFLDEFPEFDTRVLESLRQPMEDRIVHISRARGSAKFPAGGILVAAMNPCPCGYFGSRKKTCSCSAHALAKYQRKVSGPIMDRIDIWLEVEHIDYEKLDQQQAQSLTSDDMRNHVQQARDFSFKRQAKKNAFLSARDLEHIPITDTARALLRTSAERLGLSPRSYHRVVKVARSIADLEQSASIEDQHILEALQYRPKLYQS